MTYIGKKPENIISTKIDTTTGTFSGEVDAGSLDISGNADIDGTLEADAITIDGTAIASVLSPIAGSSSIVTTGALNAGSITSGFGSINNGSSTITTTGAITGGSLVVDEMTLNADTLTATDTFTIDSANIITLDSAFSSGDAGGIIRLADAGTQFGDLHEDSGNFLISSAGVDKDLIFKGNDGGAIITPLTLDMSAGGMAVFSGGVNLSSSAISFSGSISTPQTAAAIFRPVDNTLAFSTANSERVRIDSSGRVLIGTTTEGHSSGNGLTIASTGSAGITVRSGTSSDGSLLFSDGTSGADEYRGYVQYNHTNNLMDFGTDGSRRMRIDSSGRVLIGTTNAVIIGNGGIALKGADGRIDASANGGSSALFDRRTNDGDIVGLYKDGSAVGSIGTNSGGTYFAGNGSSLLSYGDAVLPRSTTGGSRNGIVDLGNSANVFNNLYINGGAFIGGTGSANKLDDYEEGTFTVTLTGADFGSYNQSAFYTKIGQQVFFNYYTGAFDIANAGNTAGFTGLPFTSANNAQQYGLFLYVHGSAITSSRGGYVIKNDTRGIWVTNDGVADRGYVNGSGKYIMIAGSYQTSS
jgi:hypothetical protein